MLPLARFIVWEIFDKGRYSHPGFGLRPGDTVVDVGANLGIFVLWAAPQIQGGRLIAVEPDPSARACLELNVERNHLASVTVVPAALGADGGEMELVAQLGAEGLTHKVSFRPPLLTRLVALRNPKSEVRFRAPRLSLSHLIEEHQLEAIDLLKVDCEGGEYEVFDKVEPRHWPLIRRIALEVHEFRGAPGSRYLVDLLESNGVLAVARYGPIERLLARTGRMWAARPEYLRYEPEELWRPAARRGARSLPTVAR